MSIRKLKRIRLVAHPEYLIYIQKFCPINRHSIKDKFCHDTLKGNVEENEWTYQLEK